MDNTKIDRDKYYSRLYKITDSIKDCMDAGYFEDNLKSIPYDLDVLTTPFMQLDDLVKDKENVVLLTTGGFSPIHEGHLEMMIKAEEKLEVEGYNVLGGYFSPCNYKYLESKGNTFYTDNERIGYMGKYLSSSRYRLDMWESMYLKDTVNFTAVLDRLEKYLHRHFSNKVKVIYVYGMDNVSFHNCFKGIRPSVCVYRDTDEKYIREIYGVSDKEVYFVRENKYSALSSTKINMKGKYTGTNQKETERKAYLVRNEGELPLTYLGNGFKKKQLIFKNNFINTLTDYIKGNVEELPIKEQIERANKDLKGVKTISFDSFYEGTYNIEMSRQFEMSGVQDIPKMIVNSPKSDSLPSQVSKIDNTNKYVVVDDDTVSGNTLRMIKGILSNYDIEGYYFLADYLDTDYYDVVDLRDFIIGAEHGGLVVKFNGSNIRVPYMYPFVNLATRASIDIDKCKEFSGRVLDLNKEMYADTNIMVRDICNNEIWEYLGYGDSSVFEMIVSLKNNYV